MNLLSFRDAVLADLRARLTQLKFEPHGGRFDIEELDSFAVAAPEIRIAVLAARRADKGRNQWTVDFAAYIVSGRDRQLRASERGLRLATVLSVYLANVGPGGGGNPDRVSYQNLYSAEGRERNKHLGAVTWSQLVELSDDENAIALDDFLTFAATYDLGPEPDSQAEAADTLTLPPPEAP